MSALSLQTIGILDAWSEDSPWLILVCYSPGYRYLVYPPDCWHNWHLGWAKDILGSVIVLMLPFFGPGNVDVRLGKIFESMKVCPKTR